MDTVAKITDQTSASFKGNTQAMMELGQIWAAGCRNVSNIIATASQSHLDHMTTTMKAMSDVRTIKGAMELQMSAARTSMEQAVSTTSKLSTASMELADQGMAPMKACMDSTMARFTSIKSDLA